MSRWRIEVQGKGLRKASVEKVLKRLQDELKDCTVSVTDASPPESRADRFEAAKTLVEEAKYEFEELYSELESWFEGMPENLQAGQKGEELEAAISELSDVINTAEELADCEVNFPSMY